MKPRRNHRWNRCIIEEDYCLSFAHGEQFYSAFNRAFNLSPIPGADLTTIFNPHSPSASGYLYNQPAACQAKESSFFVLTNDMHVRQAHKFPPATLLLIQAETQMRNTTFLSSSTEPNGTEQGERIERKTSLSRTISKLFGTHDVSLSSIYERANGLTSEQHFFTHHNPPIARCKMASRFTSEGFRCNFSSRTVHPACHSCLSGRG